MDGSSVTSKGQVTIPRDVRRELGIRQGSQVRFTVRKGKVEMQVLHRAPAQAVSGFGLLRARRRHLPADFDPARLLSPKRRAGR